MREKRTSLEDIAKAVGVSKATVSFVLNDKGDEFNISKKKQELIREKAKELAYVPNFFAKSLRQGQTKTIGVVLADITNPFYAALCKTIQEELYSRGYSTLIVNTHDDKQLEKILMKELIQRSIDGMIISPCNDISELIPILNDTHIPVVFADRPGDDHADFVGINNENEAFKLLQNFTTKVKRVVVVCPSVAAVSTIEKRIEGTLRACKQLDVEHSVLKLSDLASKADEQVREELKKGTDAFVALNNMVAFKLLAALNHAKAKIPKDIKLVSFDDHEAYPYMDPPISALRQPIYHIGLESVERLVDRLKEAKVPGKHLLLACEFIARGSH
jgi:LacI family transcriptional regulator